MLNFITYKFLCCIIFLSTVCCSYLSFYSVTGGDASRFLFPHKCRFVNASHCTYFVFHNQSVMSSIIIVVHLRRKPNGFPLRLALKLTVNTRSKLPAWKFHQSVGVCNSFHRGNRVILPKARIIGYV